MILTDLVLYVVSAGLDLCACLGPQCYEGAWTEERTNAYFVIMFNIQIEKQILDIYYKKYIKSRKNKNKQISCLLALIAYEYRNINCLAKRYPKINQ